MNTDGFPPSSGFFSPAFDEGRIHIFLSFKELAVVSRDRLGFFLPGGRDVHDPSGLGDLFEVNAVVIEDTFGVIRGSWQIGFGELAPEARRFNEFSRSSVIRVGIDPEWSEDPRNRKKFELQTKETKEIIETLESAKKMFECQKQQK